MESQTAGAIFNLRLGRSLALPSLFHQPFATDHLLPQRLAPSPQAYAMIVLFHLGAKPSWRILLSKPWS
jgi:hypothetical protein